MTPFVNICKDSIQCFMFAVNVMTRITGQSATGGVGAYLCTLFHETHASLLRCQRFLS